MFVMNRYLYKSIVILAVGWCLEPTTVQAQIDKILEQMEQQKREVATQAYQRELPRDVELADYALKLSHDICYLVNFTDQAVDRKRTFDYIINRHRQTEVGGYFYGVTQAINSNQNVPQQDRENLKYLVEYQGQVASQNCPGFFTQLNPKIPVPQFQRNLLLR